MYTSNKGFTYLNKISDFNVINNFSFSIDKIKEYFPSVFTLPMTAFIFEIRTQKIKTSLDGNKMSVTARNISP